MILNVGKVLLEVNLYVRTHDTSLYIEGLVKERIWTQRLYIRKKVCEDADVRGPSATVKPAASEKPQMEKRYIYTMRVYNAGRRLSSRQTESLTGYQGTPKGAKP